MCNHFVQYKQYVFYSVILENVHSHNIKMNIQLKYILKLKRRRPVKLIKEKEEKKKEKSIQYYK